MAELMFGNKEMEREDIIMMADCFSKLLEKCCSNYNHKNLRVKDYDGDRVPFYFGKPNEEIEVMPGDKRIISSKSLSLLCLGELLSAICRNKATYNDKFENCYDTFLPYIEENKDAFSIKEVIDRSQIVDDDCDDICSESHAILRFKQRFNTTITQNDITTIKARFKNNYNTRCLFKGRRREIHFLEYKEISFLCVCDVFTKDICTVMPKEWYLRVLARNIVYEYVGCRNWERYTGVSYRSYAA